jgi:hypothetical protein
MSKELNPQHINQLLSNISEKGGYTLSELIERLPSLIAYYQGLQLTQHPQYAPYLNNNTIPATTLAIVQSLNRTSNTLANTNSEIKSLKPSFGR